MSARTSPEEAIGAGNALVGPPANVHTAVSAGRNMKSIQPQTARERPLASSARSASASSSATMRASIALSLLIACFQSTLPPIAQEPIVAKVRDAGRKKLGTDIQVVEIPAEKK